LTANSPEAAVSELKRKMPDAKIPSADMVFNYIYENEIEEILSSFRKINSEILALTGVPDELVDVAVDFHDIGYYGDKDGKGVINIYMKSIIDFALKEYGRVKQLGDRLMEIESVIDWGAFRRIVGCMRTRGSEAADQTPMRC
jgi:hypothetical protein